MESDLRTPLDLGMGRDKTNESPPTPEPSRTGGTSQEGWLRRFFAFAGPAYLVSVGYMDPGNWATDIQGGAKFGYALLWVIGISNLMAMLLQTLCARLGLATGKDLAQACRDYYKRPAVIALWVGCEIAIIACDLAEVIGSAIAIKLLTGLPLTWGVLITGLDVFVLLGLMRWGFRKIEAVIMVLVGTVAVCFLLQTVLARPNLGEVAHGLFVPSIPSADAWVIAIGILGATVMPHNLYLHSSIVKEREVEQTSPKIREAIRYATVDTLVALFLAFFVNAAILVVAGAAFHTRGHFGVEKLEDAHQLLTPILGGAAATAFAVALLASGQSSTITGTMAGTDRDGRLSSYPPSALAAATHYAFSGDYSSDFTHSILENERCQSVDPLASCAFDAASVRYFSLDGVHLRPEAHGRVRQSCVAQSGGVHNWCSN